MLSLTWLKLTSTPLALGSAIQGLQVARVAALASEGTRTETARTMRAILISLSIGASPYNKRRHSESGGPARARNSMQPSEASPAAGTTNQDLFPGIGECASKGQQIRVTRMSLGPLWYSLNRIGGCQIRLFVLLVIPSIEAMYRDATSLLVALWYRHQKVTSESNLFGVIAAKCF